MKTSIYDLSLQGLQIEELLLDSVGEITPEIQERMDALLMAGPETMEAAAAVVTQLQMSAKMAEEESDRLRARSKTFEAQADTLKKRMTFALDTAFHGKLKTAKWSLWTQKSADRTIADLVPGITPEMLHKERPDLVRVKMELDREKCVKIYEPIRDIQRRLEELNTIIEDAKRALKTKPSDTQAQQILDDARATVKDLVDKLAELPGLPELLLFEEREGSRYCRIK